MVEHLSDEQLAHLRRGGHDPDKVYNAYKAAVEHNGQPTVILAKTDQGLRPGRSRRRPEHHAPAENLNDEELREFRARFEIPIPDEGLHQAPFYRPPTTARR